MINFTFYFKTEDEIDVDEGREWLRSNWTISFYFVGIYLIFLVIGKQWMKSRPAYNLRGLLICWNVGLSIFSLMMCIKVMIPLLQVVRNFGFYYSVCYPHYQEQSKSLVFCAQLFGYSKILELGDTVFIVLRKQPLIFLHWYHHVTVLLYCWYTCHAENGPAIWFAFMNATAHSFMYFYYAMKAAKFHIPKTVSMVITTIQLAQMVMAVFISSYCFFIKSRGEYCGVADETLDMSFLMYFSYFVLFSHFFYKAYIPKKLLQEKALAAKKLM